MRVPIAVCLPAGDRPVVALMDTSKTALALVLFA
jgi:hypothetical protein